MQEKAKALIAEHLDVPLDAVLDQATFRDLGADSLDLIALPLALEEAFDIQIPEQSAEACTTVADAILLISKCAQSELLGNARALADV